MASSKGSIVVHTEAKLEKMIKKVLPKRTVLIVGEAGIGKTVLVENMKLEGRFHIWNVINEMKICNSAGRL